MNLLLHARETANTINALPLRDPLSIISIPVTYSLSGAFCDALSAATRLGSDRDGLFRQNALFTHFARRLGELDADTWFHCHPPSHTQGEGHSPQQPHSSTGRARVALAQVDHDSESPVRGSAMVRQSQVPASPFLKAQAGSAGTTTGQDERSTNVSSAKVPKIPLARPGAGRPAGRPTPRGPLPPR